MSVWGGMHFWTFPPFEYSSSHIILFLDMEDDGEDDLDIDSVPFGSSDEEEEEEEEDDDVDEEEEEEENDDEEEGLEDVENAGE